MAKNPLKIASIEPREIPTAGGVKVSVHGSGYAPGLRVKVGSTLIDPATITLSGPSSLEFRAPPGKAGYADLELIGSTSVQQKKAFLYVASPAPVISAVVPNRGPTHGRIDVRIEGEHFHAASQVLVDGRRPLSIILLSDHALEIMPPPGAHGQLVSITVKNPDGSETTIERAFQYDQRFDSGS